MMEVDPPDITVFVWGSNSEGQLGLAGLESEKLLLPTPINSECGIIRNISCGHSHTLLESDRLLSCGSNDYGQLGHTKSRRKPGEVDVLHGQCLSQHAAGAAHSMALTDSGQLFTWGDNQHKQVGLGELADNHCPTPKNNKKLSSHTIIQIACGSNHCLALTNYGKLFVWGDNRQGQLGLGDSAQSACHTPTELTSVQGLVIRQIAAGGDQSFLLTVSGALYGWGNNSSGQLGLGDNTSKQYFPRLVKTLRSQNVRYIACGVEHTAVLTMDGGVFTFGAGMHGQLGHNCKQNELLPRKVFELMGSVVTQIALGRCHTLAYVGSAGKLYSFGMGFSGQLGIGNSIDHMTSPALVKGPFVPSTGDKSFLPVGVENQPVYIVRQIYAGGDQCMVLAVSPNTKQMSVVPVDMCRTSMFHPIVSLTLEQLEQYNCIPPNHHLDSAIMEEIELTFSSLSCHNASFLAQDNNFSPCSSTKSGVDLDLAMHYYAKMAEIRNKQISECILSSIEKLVVSSLSPSPPDIEALRVYLTIPCCKDFYKPLNFRSLICPFAQAVNNLSTLPSRILSSWWGLLHEDFFIKLITIYKETIVYILCLPQATNQIQLETRTTNMFNCLKLLRKLNEVNEQRDPVLPIGAFYIHELTEKFDIRMDYVRWLQNDTNVFCKFPFILDASAKSHILQAEAMLQMQIAIEEVNRRNITNLFSRTIDPINPCLLLFIHRDRIIQDTINQLNKCGEHDLKKPLKVVFVNEEALDEGGVKKEFFLLILKEIMDPKYGMFKHYKDSNLLWFQSQTFEEDHQMFELIGILCGLAIYNASIIDLHFPLALYKKILKRPITLDDLKHLDPVVHRSIQELLAYDGDDLEDVLNLTFEISLEVFGDICSKPLKPGGQNIAVTKENRKEYADLYIDYVFNVSVKKQYDAFSLGFNKVCGGRAMQLFHPEELQAMVIGHQIYDWEEFEKNTEYKPDYTRQHPTIIIFWNVFGSLDLDQKKQFLLFLSGSDRIPIYGMKAVKMIIQPTSSGIEFLPCAHTCFNILDLPRYDNETTLRTKLLQAIQHAQGFGLV